MTTPRHADKWIGFRQGEDGQTVAMFAMPSGRTRSVPVDRRQMLDALNDLARAIKYDLNRRETTP